MTENPRSQPSLIKSSFRQSCAPIVLLVASTVEKHHFLSTVRGDIPNARLKLRLKWPRSLKPCANAASVTERTSPCIRATRLASSRSDHTQRIGVAPSTLNRRFRLRTDIAPAAASSSGPSPGSSRFRTREPHDAIKRSRDFRPRQNVAFKITNGRHQVHDRVRQSFCDLRTKFQREIDVQRPREEFAQDRRQWVAAVDLDRQKVIGSV